MNLPHPVPGEYNPMFQRYVDRVTESDIPATFGLDLPAEALGDFRKPLREPTLGVAVGRSRIEPDHKIIGSDTCRCQSHRKRAFLIG